MHTLGGAQGLAAWWTPASRMRGWNHIFIVTCYDKYDNPIDPRVRKAFADGALSTSPKQSGSIPRTLRRPPLVKRTLTYLIHGSGDFIQRVHDVLYDADMKLGMFGYFCALELYGTLKPEDCPPINGRMAKALRYLGYDERGA
jgi:hypothetical protein